MAPLDAPVDRGPILPPDDASKRACKLDNGTDPVGLCIQKKVLRGQHEAAFSSQGVVASWDSLSFAADKGDGGVALHDLHDDVAYGASIALYHTSSGRYGDTEYTQTLDADLLKLVPILETELKTLPQEYGGELYAQLRLVAAGLRYVDRNSDADAIDVLADAYGRAIYKAHFFPIGMGDGGPLDGILASDAVTLEYAPADVVTGALALLDMAQRHALDDAASAAAWQTAARLSIDHVVVRAHEPVTKMYLRSLRVVPGGTKDDSSHAPAPADLVLSDVAATIALALTRAQDLVTKNPTALSKVSTYPFEVHAEEAIASLNAAPPLWDAMGLGYMEGYVPSTTTLLTGKPTRTNALMFAAIHRANLTGTTPFGPQLKPLRTLMLERVPPNTTFFSLDGNQSGYFLKVSKGFAFAANDAGLEPRAKSYFSAAASAAVEGLNEQYFGVP